MTYSTCDQRLDKCADFYEQNGSRRLEKLMEEAEELYAEISEQLERIKNQPGNNLSPLDAGNEKSRDKIISEMVDVEITLQSCRRAYDIEDDEWEVYRNFKINRQMVRLARDQKRLQADTSRQRMYGSASLPSSISMGQAQSAASDK